MPILTIQVTDKQYQFLQAHKISENRNMTWVVRAALMSYINTHVRSCKVPTCKPPTCTQPTCKSPTCKQHTSTHKNLHGKSNTLGKGSLTVSYIPKKKKNNIYIPPRSAGPEQTGAEPLLPHNRETESATALIMPLLGAAGGHSRLSELTKGLVAKLLKKGATTPEIVSVVKWALQWMTTPRIEVMLKPDNYSGYVINAAINPPKQERPLAGMSPYVEDIPQDMPSPDEQRGYLEKLRQTVG